MDLGTSLTKVIFSLYEVVIQYVVHMAEVSFKVALCFIGIVMFCKIINTNVFKVNVASIYSCTMIRQTNYLRTRGKTNKIA